MNNRSKYPRTYHLPWSHPHSDDKIVSNLDIFNGMEIVVLEKLDGENTTVYHDGFSHARSIDSRHNYTRDWAKNMFSVLCHDIPKNHRFVFENVTYYHSISYKKLESFCYLLSIWDDNDFCLSFDDTIEYAELLDLATPRVFYRGIFDETILKDLSNSLNLDEIEGYVIRNLNTFHIDDFSKNVAKFVREGHVQDKSEHWIKRTFPNQLDPAKKVKPFYMG